MGNWAYRWPERPVPVREQVPASAAAGPGRARSPRPRPAGGETEASSRPGTAAAGPDVEPDVPAAWHRAARRRPGPVHVAVRRNPAADRGPQHVVTRSATPVLSLAGSPESAAPRRARGCLDRLDRTSPHLVNTVLACRPVGWVCGCSLARVVFGIFFAMRAKFRSGADPGGLARARPPRPRRSRRATLQPTRRRRSVRWGARTSPAAWLGHAAVAVLTEVGGGPLRNAFPGQGFA